MKQKSNPGLRRDNNCYTDSLPADQIKALPENLLDALRRLNQELTRSLSESFLTAYLKLKHQEWNA